MGNRWIARRLAMSEECSVARAIRRVKEDAIGTQKMRNLEKRLAADYRDWSRVNREVAAAQNTWLVFFGDSIARSYWLRPTTSRELWENQFADFEPTNMGNSGDIRPVMLLDVNQANVRGTWRALQNAPVFNKINHNSANFTATSVYLGAKRTS